ncbi:TetR/AcrR family transcriptional regulator [Geosporobacter ferrireducens]|uniref:TetR family transcriptional regulator n=1 Tax=Geosporobacter ferrireducens TaxID=1424294 RepID=A0A1D8GEW5_9FIRM|nr:TetR/AcrR family transcriptional regulator [Geosporobacter ferrireducens]AOT69450.1 TetR family transcriptional regulator [Geosporobacter ferrireducens]
MQILKDEIRNKILDVAENLFYQNGFRDTTTRSIAKAVGISVSNLYLYYENKEAIFYGVTDGFFEYFINGFKTFVNHDDKSNGMNIDISHVFQRIIKVDQKKFIIIADKSQGTKYEGFKEQIINILSNHMLSQVNKEFVEDELIIYILAKNFMEGIIEIAKNYKDDRWLEKSIGTLVSYHINGMKHLM